MGSDIEIAIFNWFTGSLLLKIKCNRYIVMTTRYFPFNESKEFCLVPSHSSIHSIIRSRIWALPLRLIPLVFQLFSDEENGRIRIPSSTIFMIIRFILASCSAYSFFFCFYDVGRASSAPLGLVTSPGLGGGALVRLNLTSCLRVTWNLFPPYDF